MVAQRTHAVSTRQVDVHSHPRDHASLMTKLGGTEVCTSNSKHIEVISSSDNISLREFFIKFALWFCFSDVIGLNFPPNGRALRSVLQVVVAFSLVFSAAKISIGAIAATVLLHFAANCGFRSSFVCSTGRQVGGPGFDRFGDLIKWQQSLLLMMTETF